MRTLTLLLAVFFIVRNIWRDEGELTVFETFAERATGLALLLLAVLP